MDESSLFAVNSNHQHSDRTFSDPKIVQIWPSVLTLRARYSVILLFGNPDFPDCRGPILR